MTDFPDPVFDRDALIDELLRFDLTGLSDSVLRTSFDAMRENRLDVLCGEEESLNSESTVKFVVFEDLVQKMIAKGMVPPHIIPKYRRLVELSVRVTICNMQATNPLELYRIKMNILRKNGKL